MFGNVIEKREVSIAKAKEILAKVKNQNYEQKHAFEYASKFAKTSSEDAIKILEELRESGIPRIKNRHLKKIVDLMPKKADEIKVILAKEDLTLSKGDIETILDILAKYR